MTKAIILSVISLIISFILGYGYWHSATHASFYIQLNQKSLAIGNQKILPEVEIAFLDANGRILANGISDELYNYVHLIHPEVGDCHEIEKAASFSQDARVSWQQCFEHLSMWISLWANDIRTVNLKTKNCSWENISVTVSKNNSGWFLWWVPHPHIGGKPYTYYSTSITVDETECRD